MPNKVGIIAGWGRYPIVVADALKRQGFATYCLGIKDHADPVLAETCDDFQWIGMARLGAAIRYFRRRDVSTATMAGKFHKILLYQPWRWVHHLPDWRAIRTFYPHFVTHSKDGRDDTLLSAVVGAFADAGVTLAPATDYAPELLAQPGCFTERRPSAGQETDIEFGWRLAKEMGRLDVGQSVAVKDRAVLAVEAIEGTDACIRRAGQLCKNGGFTVVKVAKPQQDMRFDVPTIGLGTLESMVASGCKLLAIEAGRTILIDADEIISFANRHKLMIVAITEPAAPLASL